MNGGEAGELAEGSCVVMGARNVGEDESILSIWSAVVYHTKLNVIAHRVRLHYIRGCGTMLSVWWDGEKIEGATPLSLACIRMRGLGGRKVEGVEVVVSLHILG